MLKKIYFTNGGEICFKGNNSKLIGSNISFIFPFGDIGILKSEYKKIKKKLRP